MTPQRMVRVVGLLADGGAPALLVCDVPEDVLARYLTRMHPAEIAELQLDRAMQALRGA